MKLDDEQKKALEIAIAYLEAMRVTLGSARNKDNEIEMIKRIEAHNLGTSIKIIKKMLKV